jgi:polyhydroxybutyrate depolymerase
MRAAIRQFSRAGAHQLSMDPLYPSPAFYWWGSVCRDAPPQHRDIPFSPPPAHVVNANNMQRTFLLHVPPNLSAEKSTALMFVFHGLSDNGLHMSQITGMSQIADANGFLVVYPDGTVFPGPLSWNAGGCCGDAVERRIDEPAFVRAIITELEQTFTIDPNRIYATGFSNGAMLSYRLGCEMSETFAAIAPVAGLLTFSPCQPTSPVSLLHIHGSSDVSVPYRGGGTNPSTGLPFTSVIRGIAAWVRLDSCPDSPQTEETGIALHTTYAPCQNGSAVELYVVQGLGHVWPADYTLPASRIIWEFFAAHPKQ